MADDSTHLLLANTLQRVSALLWAAADVSLSVTELIEGALYETRTVSVSVSVAPLL